jgi:hypothetical protein
MHLCPGWLLWNRHPRSLSHMSIRSPHYQGWGVPTLRIVTKRTISHHIDRIFKAPMAPPDAPWSATKPQMPTCCACPTRIVRRSAPAQPGSSAARALLAGAPDDVMFADAGAPAVLAFAPLAVVLALIASPSAPLPPPPLAASDSFPPAPFPPAHIRTLALH